MIFLTTLITVVIVALSALHVYWAVGGKAGFKAALPEVLDSQGNTNQSLFTPSSATTFTVAFLLLASAFIVLQAGNVVQVLPSWMATLGVWVIGFVFLLRSVGDFRYVGFFKRVKGTRFAQIDSRFYSPLTLFLGLSILWLAYQA